MEQVDIAVVGGGPAGAAAAEAAAATGADTVLLEQGVPRADRDALGPDSTDAAGMLDYWVDLMDESYRDIPDDVILRELQGATFVGPSSRVELSATGMEASYPNFGFTFHRARMDDWWHERAAGAGADLRIGESVRGLETTWKGTVPAHTLTTASGETLSADRVVLADGPQRRVTIRALDQFTPPGRQIADILSPTQANHIAYQEYRRFPAELFDDDRLWFWWGYMPGETAYPWVFPNDETVARVGLTMPIGLDLEAVDHPESYALLRPDDTTIPNGGTYIERLLEHEFGDEYDVASDFPIVTDRGKTNGTETYPISSTRPIDSPVRANIAVAGGAMGTTSAFHEGGYHVAIRSGKIAGRLAGEDRLERYNDAWKAAIGDELKRNIVFADIVADYEPDDWDWAFSVASRMLGGADEGNLLSRRFSAGIGASKTLIAYKRRKFSYRKGRYVQFPASEYVY